MEQTIEPSSHGNNCSFQLHMSALYQLAKGERTTPICLPGVELERLIDATMISPTLLNGRPVLSTWCSTPEPCCCHAGFRGVSLLLHRAKGMLRGCFVIYATPH